MNKQKDRISKNLSLTIFSYLTGDELLHKIARLNKQTRGYLPGAGLLDQPRICTIDCRKWGFTANKIKYAISLATGFCLTFTCDRVIEVKSGDGWLKNEKMT